jgi:hypothetical protein
MSPVRRVAVALAAAAITVVTIGATAPAANADITWGYSFIKAPNNR